ncbi:hypothetical protein ACFWE5_00680 [Cellulosimicrobium funkei]|uniref:hypothetical protein n=1 Tax=Cellulosimicrobium funkei TaxID=264251 RepID=UPI0036623A7E
MTQTSLNPAQDDELVALYEAGTTLVELGDQFSIHRCTAAVHLVRRSVPIRRRGLDECHLAEAVEMYDGGLTLLDVGLRFGVGQQAVRRALAAHGVAIHRSGRRRLVSRSPA